MPLSGVVHRTADAYAALYAGAQLHLPEQANSLMQDMVDCLADCDHGSDELFGLLRRTSRLRATDSGKLKRRLIEWRMQRSGGRLRRLPARLLVRRSMARQHELAHTRVALVLGERSLRGVTKDYLEVWRVRPVRGWGCAALAGPGFIADQGAFVPLPGVSQREGVMVPSGSPSSPAEQLERALLEDERVRRAVVRARAAGGFTAVVELDFELTSVWAHGQGLEFSTYRSLAEHPPGGGHR